MNSDTTEQTHETRPVAVFDLTESASQDSAGKVAARARERRKAATRERLLDVASELFARNGFEETTYDEIARAGAVARQTVFNYFPRKEDFVVAWSARRREEVAHVLQSSAFVGESATSRLALIICVLAESYERAPAAGRVYTLAWVKLGGPILERRELAFQFGAVIADGQASGEIRDDVDAETAGQLIRAAYFDALWLWAAPDRPNGAPSLFSDLLTRLELILTGLCVVQDRDALRRSMRLAQAIERARGSEDITPADPRRREETPGG
jgi:TetR/AcrR family transcriptional regulator, cholesterol catabolism regulator